MESEDRPKGYEYKNLGLIRALVTETGNDPVIEGTEHTLRQFLELRFLEFLFNNMDSNQFATLLRNRDESIRRNVRVLKDQVID